MKELRAKSAPTLTNVLPMGPVMNMQTVLTPMDHSPVLVVTDIRETDYIAKILMNVIQVDTVMMKPLAPMRLVHTAVTALSDIQVTEKVPLMDALKSMNAPMELPCLTTVSTRVLSVQTPMARTTALAQKVSEAMDTQPAMAQVAQISTNVQKNSTVAIHLLTALTQLALMIVPALKDILPRKIQLAD
jgi:hypothetical protein